jgi:geranylgeranyl diphosphate synthase type I
LRPLFAAIGFLGAQGAITPEVIRAVSSLELVHVCALIHDDVMDASDTRRGAPAIHKQFEARHGSENLQGSSAQFGVASAILLGDLALIWAAKALPFYDEMRIELMAGQYLDIYEQALASESAERSLKVARYKSGKYSIERPLHFGASLAPGFSPSIIDIYSNFGLPLGEAFQLRDDLIGVFGDPLKTGKPAGDDLREGKRTVLVALALSHCNSTQRQEFLKYFGQKELDSHGIDSLRQIITDTGAFAEVETMIEIMSFKAQEAITHGGLPSGALNLLNDLAVAATQRSS